MAADLCRGQHVGIIRAGPSVQNGRDPHCDRLRQAGLADGLLVPGTRPDPQNDFPPDRNDHAPHRGADLARSDASDQRTPLRDDHSLPRSGVPACRD